MYYISSAEELKEFADKVNDDSGKHTDIDAELTADIDLSEICGENIGGQSVSWTPIGNSSNEYTGTFDGDGHTISGLTINSSSDNYQGLFGYLSTDGDNTGTVKDLTVSGTVSGGWYVGGIAGQNGGRITDCAFSGNVTSSGNYVGGVVGHNQNGGSVTNSYNTGAVSGGVDVGGVVGNNSFSATVTNCYNTGNVSGPDSVNGETTVNVGGVVGYNSFSVTVTNCYNTGKVSGPDSGSYVGGVVGWNDSSTVENCYNTGQVNGSGNSVGGVVGYNDDASVKNCYNTGSVKGNGNTVGGVVGLNNGNVTGCYFLQGTAEKGIGNGSGTTGATAVTSLNVQSQFKGWDFTDTWRISQSLNRPVLQANAEDNALSGTGKQEDPYKIYRAIDLKNFRDLVNGANDQTADPDAHAKLMNNIDLSSVCGAELSNGTSWEPIGNEDHLYTGTFDGNGKTISGLYINSSSDNYQGLFGYLSTDGDNTGTVKDLTVSGNVSGYWYVGGVVGYNNGGTVTGCIFSGSGEVSGSEDVGGVVGRNDGSVINCYNTGSVTGVTGSTDYVGGVVGYTNGGTVENCYNTVTVSGSDHVGGVVGGNDSGTVKNCYNTGTGTVTGTVDFVGGVVGQNFGGTVENCYNTGAVSGPDSGSGNSVGGVVGYNYHGASVENCYNTGAVSGPDSGSGDWYVGGVVGYNRGSVTNCYNTDSVTVTGSGSRVGGVVGWNDDGRVENCYNTGTVSDGTTSGGVVGQNSGSVTNCYFLKTADVNENLSGIGGGSGTSSNVEPRTADAFHSGEVAYLLEQNISDDKKPVWGQSKLNTPDSLPTLVALNPDAAKEVYQLTFDWSYGGAPEGTTTTTNVYTNGSVAIPEINHDRAGYHISGWKDASGAPVTTETAVTADTTYIAEWTANTYTITVTAGSGGTVSGGGNVTHGDSVEVTATANQGYHFVNWTENGTEVSTSATYSFTATANRTLTANFAADAVEPDPDPTPTPDPTPSGPSTGDSTGWDDIRDELENAENGDEITIDMGDETKVPAEIFESLAGKDVEISFDLGDIQWTVNGADIPTDTDFTDLDLGVNLDTHGIPVNVINTITGEVGTVQITLAHDGEFGFTMTLTAPLGKENAGFWANLYHYDEDAEALNFEAAAKIDETGSVTIPFSHASQYAIVIDTHSHATVDVSDIFLDIAPNAWYKDAIQYAYDNGLMTGVSDTEFAPEATTTRAMIVSILARLEGVTTAEAAGFADVDDNDWYATAVNWAASVGVVNGYEDNTFRPNTAITREQLAAILMNYAAYKGEDVSNRADLTSYTDQPSTWAEEAISWSVAEGLLTGVTADTLQPQGAATRAQVAAILQRFLSE